MKPSNLPSSFASAAAGQGSARDGRSNSRSDPRGSGEWNRRDGRSANGTVTFRRSSTTPSLAAQASNQATTDPIPPTPDLPLSTSSAQYVIDTPGPSTTYSRADLLDIYRETDFAFDAVDKLFASGWNPGHQNGSHAGRWAKSTEHAPQEPELCWVSAGSVSPVGFRQMDTTEREFFAADVNSPMKPPQPKETTHQSTLNGRKSSVSQGATNFGLSTSPSAARPGPRRRETTDTNPFPGGALVSPNANRSFSARDEQSFWQPRNRRDTEAPVEETPDDTSGTATCTTEPQPPQTVATKPPFSFPGLVRSSTTGTSFMSNSSIWGQSPTSSATPQGPMGTFGHFAMPGSAIGEKPKFSRQESRFANIIGHKDSSENIKEEGKSWRPRPRTDTDPFGADEGGGSGRHGTAPREGSPLLQGRPGPSFDTPLKGTAAEFGFAGLDDNTPLSPSETNPFRSPAGGPPEDEAPFEKLQPSGFTSLPRSFAPTGFDGSDRSQTSSAGPAKGIGGFGGAPFGGGWPSVPGVGTPDRERQFSAFGSGLFGPSMNDIQSPSLGSLSGGVFGAPTGGSLRGSSKLGSLFPAAMQAQMQTQDQNLDDSVAENQMGSLGRSSGAAFGRDSDSPMRTARGVFDLFSSAEIPKQAPIGTQASGVPAGTTVATGQEAEEAAGAQVRQMVMPDRMRWVYLDPQGHTQGPFTGLEMNDWYKGNFFSPDLRIKKLEDPEFEPLGHLIRRIGNSREPFLVPQVGIPHGPPTQSYPTGNAATGVVPPLPNAFPQFGRVLPADEQNNLERRKQEEQLKLARQRDYFAQQQLAKGIQHHSSAHSLQSQQSFGSISSPVGMPPQAPIGAGMPPPSSVIAPATNDFFGMPNTGAPQPPPQPGMGGSSLNMLLDETVGPLTLEERQIRANMLPASASRGHGPQQTASPPVGPGTTAETGLRSQLPHSDQLEDDPQGFSARLREFEQYQAMNAEETAALALAPATPSDPLATNDSDFQPPASIPTGPHPPMVISTAEPSVDQKAMKKATPEGLDGDGREEGLSLTQQVQKMQAAKESVRDQTAKTLGLPMPFPPPAEAGTPLPAPTAQRTPSTLPDQYATRSQSQTPEAQSATSQAAPPLAPWAPDSAKSRKGPSFQEIQEAEARTAAKNQEAAAAQRRLALEQEAAAIREREKEAAAGLPTSSTWGHSSPVAGNSGNTVASAWAKPGAAKAAIAAVDKTKRTLADIQREEEARKKKELTSQPGGGSGSSKLYAQLAGRPGQAPGTTAAATSAAQSGASSGGWTTVSAGGKPKPPPAGPSSVSRVVGAAAKTPAPAAAAKPAARKDAKPDMVNVAMDEFKKWLERELKRGVNSVGNVSDMTTTLMNMPIDDPTLISDIIYSSSSTMDGRHFAEEFIRRKKLALRGVVEKAAPATESGKNAAGGGWNEVAKKGSHAKAEAVGGSDVTPNTSFKVVTGRKKGGKK